MVLGNYCHQSYCRRRLSGAFDGHLVQQLELQLPLSKAIAPPYRRWIKLYYESLAKPKTSPKEEAAAHRLSIPQFSMKTGTRNGSRKGLRTEHGNIFLPALHAPCTSAPLHS